MIFGTTYGYVPAATFTLSCSGLPAGAACSFSPATLTTAASTLGFNSGANSTLTITTTAPTSGALHLESGLARFALAIIVCGGLWRIRTKFTSPFAVCVIALLTSLSGCGGSGGGSIPTRAGTYNVTVALVTGGATSTTTVQVVIN